MQRARKEQGFITITATETRARLPTAKAVTRSQTLKAVHPTRARGRCWYPFPFFISVALMGCGLLDLY